MPGLRRHASVEAGYNVYGVVNASGALEVTIRENAVARMKDHSYGLLMDSFE